MMRLVLAGLAATLFSASTGAAACREDVVQLRGDWGEYQVANAPRVGVTANLGGDDRTAVVTVQVA